MRISGSLKFFKYFAAALVMIISGCKGTNTDSSTAPPVTGAVIAETAENAADSAATAEIPENEPREDEDYLPRAGMLQCSFFESGSMAIFDSRAEDYPSEKKIICGVVPHHLAAGHMISGFLKAAAKSRGDIETVVVIATSHYGGEKLYTSFSDWDTPFGVLKTDREAVKKLRDGLGAVCDDDRMQSDHSASVHIPFIKQYFPDARAACLLVAPDSGEGAAGRLAETLAELNDGHCLFLFSIDFSHYLQPPEADAADKVTGAAVAERDLAAIERFTNDNVDSPLCLSVYIRLSELLGTEIVEADNSNTLKVNGGEYTELAYPEGVTSYFVFVSI